MEVQAEQPQRRPAVDFGLGVEKVMATLAEDNTDAANALQSIFLLMGGDVLNTCLDLVDMEMRGDQIAAAWDWCEHDAERFAQACAERQPSMVGAVNTRVQDRTARLHGEQRHVSNVDFAVQSALDAAGQGAQVERMDGNAEAIHDYWMAMLKTMTATGTYETNMRVNTGLEGGHSVVFAIRLVEILDDEGKPYKPARPEGDEVVNTDAQPDGSLPPPPENKLNG